MTLVPEEDTFCVLNLRHHLLEELFLIFNAAAIDFVEGFLAGSANGAGEFCLANASLTIENQKRQDACVLVSIKVKRELALDVFLSRDMCE